MTSRDFAMILRKFLAIKCPSSDFVLKSRKVRGRTLDRQELTQTSMTSKSPAKKKTEFDSIDALVADIKRGKMVILVDDADRENEGDLIMAAEHITPEA